MEVLFNPYLEYGEHSNGEGVKVGWRCTRLKVESAAKQLENVLAFC